MVEKEIVYAFGIKGKKTFKTFSSPTSIYGLLECLDSLWNYVKEEVMKGNNVMIELWREDKG